MHSVPRAAGPFRHLVVWAIPFAAAMLLATPVSAQECVAHWPLDGDATETISTELGTPMGGVTFPAGLIGGAAHFDGTTGTYINAGNDDKLGTLGDSMTISAWIRPEADVPTSGDPANDPDAAFISARQCNGVPAWQAYNRLGSNLYFSKWNSLGYDPGGESQFNTGVAIPDDEWSHVAITYDGGEAKFYVGGILKETHSSGLAADINDVSTLLQLGWDSCSSYFTGALDDVAIYDGALDAGSVLEIATSGKAQCQLDPATKADCKNGGWEDYGFKNQGQCIRFVNTGKDSR